MNRTTLVGRLAAATVGLAVLAGCATTVRPVAAQAPAVPAASAAAPTTATRPYTDVGRWQAPSDGAVQAVDAYWTAHFAQYFPGSYVPPTVLGVYDPSDARNPQGCGPLDADNALYCPAGDFLGWDADLIRMADRYGDGWIYMIIAHEWGHAIQARIPAELVDEREELQADCLAGAALYGAAADGIVTFEANDEKEIARGLVEVADQTPWTAAGEHGDAFQRIGEFGKGRDGGVPACLPAAGR